MTPLDPGTWYFWPVTSMTLTVVTAVHLYGRARSPDPWGVGTSLGLAGAGVVFVSLPFLAMSPSIHVGCTDTGAAVIFDPGLEVVAAALTSTLFLWLLYLVAGTPAGRATLWVAVTVLATSVAAFFEFHVSWAGLEGNCNEVGDFRPWLLLTAVVVAGITGPVMGWRMQVRRRRALS